MATIVSLQEVGWMIVANPGGARLLIEHSLGSGRKSNPITDPVETREYFLSIVGLGIYRNNRFGLGADTFDVPGFSQ